MFLASLLTTVVLVAAHGDNYLHARQASSSSAPSSSPSASPSASSSASSPLTAPISGSVASGSTTAHPTLSTPNITFTLASTNPTAAPLASIVSNEPSGPTQPLDSTAVPGSTPTFLPGAPALPNRTSYIHLPLYPPCFPAVD